MVLAQGAARNDGQHAPQCERRFLRSGIPATQGQPFCEPGEKKPRIARLLISE